MSTLDFKRWMEAKDIFGMDNLPIRIDRPDTDDRPTLRLNVEEVIADLKHRVNAKNPVELYHSTSEMQWGSQPGAIKATISPLGAVNLVIRRLVPDALGHHRWVCKGVYPLEDWYNQRGAERALSEDILTKVADIDRQSMEAPDKDFEEMEHLAVALASQLRRRVPQVFYYDSLIKDGAGNYLVKFNVRGQGVQARNQLRVEEYVVQATYDRPCGIIRIQGYQVQSTLGQHRWLPGVPDFREVFMPSQQPEDIVSAVVAHMARY
jgi:hypothetical protein